MTGYDLIENIEREYDKILHLTANENVLSECANHFYKISIANRYRMGIGPSAIFQTGNFAQKAMPEVSKLVEAAEYAACKMLHAAHVDLNCLSGIHAMMCAILTTTQPGDMVLSLFSRHGGHYCTKGVLEMTGRRHAYLPFDLEKRELEIAEIVELVRTNNVKCIYLDASVQIEPHPIKKLREAIGNDVIIIYDASHTVGLMMAGVFQDALVEGADVISANTHKTLPGPHHGMLAFRNKEFGIRASELMKKSLYSSTHINAVLSLAITILEMQKWGEMYCSQIVTNANLLAKELEKRGHKVRQIGRDKYTKTHQIHVFFEDVSNVELVQRFLDNCISVTTSMSLGNKIFARIGLQEITRLGAQNAHMSALADLIHKSFIGEDARVDVQSFKQQFPKVKYGYSLNDEIDI